MKKFYIITNEYKDENMSSTAKLESYILGNGGEITGKCASAPREEKNLYAKMKADISSDTECILVLGGDGTLLRTARNLYELDIPFLGINLGHLGYLTEGDENSMESLLDRVLADDYVIENRMLISGAVKKAGADKADKSEAKIALNDITLSRNNSLQIIDFNLYVNGQLLYNYRADGIVVSTPTGSTAYNLSCGGPIVEPTAKLFLITPIAAHSLNNRSLVLSHHDTLELEVVRKDDSTDIEYVAYFDGDSMVNLCEHDRVEIVSEEKFVKLVRLSHLSFLETLKSKMTY